MYTVSIITTSLSIDNFLCFIPFGISDSLVPSSTVVRYAYGDFTKNVLNKLFSFIRNYFSLFCVSLSTVNLYIPNHSDPFVGLLRSSIRYSSLHYIDEGNIALTCIRNQVNGVQASLSPISRLLSTLFHLRLRDHVVCSMEYQTAWILFPDILSRFVVPSNVLYSISDYTAPIDRPSSLGLPDDSFDFVILTSPLTENGYVTNNEEVDIVSSYISRLASSFELAPRILVKTHYREAASKYDSLSSLPCPVTVIDSCTVPYQIVHDIYRPHTVVAFYTSAMFVRNATIVSLILRLPQTPIITQLYAGLSEIAEQGIDITFDY